MKENRATIWQAHIKQWEQSGLSQKRYCEERDLPLSTFQWWRRRLKESVGSESAAMVQLPVTMSVVVESSDLVVEIGRFRVAIRGMPDRERLGSLLDVLENR